MNMEFTKEEKIELKKIVYGKWLVSNKLLAEAQKRLESSTDTNSSQHKLDEKAVILHQTRIDMYDSIYRKLSN